MDDIVTKIIDNGNGFTAVKYLEENRYNPISECQLKYSNGIWSFTLWRTNHEYMKRGFGKELMKKVLDRAYEELGEPDEVRYIWNGAHEYVMDWLKKNFDPVSLLPIAAQKENEVDSWDAHIYILNKDKVFRYFDVGK